MRPDPSPVRGPAPLAPADFPDLVLTEDARALVAFTADWCAPCKWLKPYLEEFATGADGRYSVFTLDVDQASGIAERYRVGSVPTVLFFRAGREVGRSVGVEPERLRGLVQALVSDTFA